MSHALGKLIRLAHRLQTPVVVYDAESGESAVLLDVDKYEKMANLREKEENNFTVWDENESFFSSPKDTWDKEEMNQEEASEPEVSWGSSSHGWESKEMFPSFSPNEELESDEDPIFFEEPV